MKIYPVRNNIKGVALKVGRYERDSILYNIILIRMYHKIFDTVRFWGAIAK